MLPGTVTSDSDLIAELLAHELGRATREPSARRPRPRAARCIEVLPQLEGAFSLVLMDEAHVIGVRDPQRLPAAVPRPARRRLGARVRDARRSTSSARTSSARSSRARWSSSTPSGVRASPLRRARPEALPVRVRLLRPPRHAALRPERARGPPAHGRGARRAGAGRRRHGDAGARVGHPRGARATPARQRHPVRRRPREEPLRRPHVHPAEPEAARRAACA